MPRRKRDAAKYAPSGGEQAALRANEGAARATRVTVSKDGDRTSFTLGNTNRRPEDTELLEAFGTADRDFVYGFLRQLIESVSDNGEGDAPGINFMLAVIKGINPQDQVEAMLAAQIARVHMATMVFARPLTQDHSPQERASAEPGFNKLSRTFVMLVEALRRHRTGGEQNITVQHVSVGEGGNAIVGNVTQGPREAAGKAAASQQPPLTDAKIVAMPDINPSKKRTPIPMRRTPKNAKRSSS